MIVLTTRYATENVPSTFVVAKSPIVTPIRSAPGLACSFATIASDRSMPCTRTPRSESGNAIRPVPMPSSSALAVPGEIGEEVDDWLDDGRIRLVRVPLVEALRHRAVRSGLRARRSRYLRSTRTALTLYSGVPISGSPTSCVSQFTF